MSPLHLSPTVLRLCWPGIIIENLEGGDPPSRPWIDATDLKLVHALLGNEYRCPFLVFALHLPLAVSVLQPPLSGTRSHLTFATLPLPIPSVAFLKLTASSRLLAPPSGSPKCLRFGLWLTLCTLNIHLLTYLLKYECALTDREL